MLLPTTLLKLYGAVNGHYWTVSRFFYEVAIFRQITVFLWKTIWHKRTQKWWNVFVHNVIETRVTHKTCTVHLTRHFRLSNATILHYRVQVWLTIQDIIWQYIVQNSRPTSANIKTTDILRCKLWTQSKHVIIYDNLRIILNEALFSIKPGAWPLFFTLIQPICWHFCDGINLPVVVDEDASIHQAKNI